MFSNLALDPTRAVHLLTDPIATLFKMEIKLAPRALAEFKSVRQKLVTPDGLRVLQEIKRLSIKVVSEGGK